MTPRVVVIGLGPGDPGLLTQQAAAAIQAIEVRFTRTARHPSVGVLGPVTTFDDVYETAVTLDEVYPEIIERLVAAARLRGEVLYAVPGSPLVAERTVELLRADPRLEVEIHPAMSFLDLAWHRLGVDPVATGVQMVDGQRFAAEAAGLPGPLLVSQCDSTLVLSDIKLTVDEGPKVTVLSRLGLPDESVTVVAWQDLDRVVEPDHLTTLWIPSLAAPVASELVRLDELMHLLREQCPWDRAQTHQSLTRHLLEETYEVLEAISELETSDDAWDHLEEELGDLLFQVVFHATLAAEEGHFTLADVARGIHDKMVGRHPHVFGEPARSWEDIKRQEKGRSGVMDGVPGNLPALLYAHKVQSRAASVGFDWGNVAGPRAKLLEELSELDEAIAHNLGEQAVNEELGDVLFTVVNLARHLHVDPESALRDAAAKFRRRMTAVEEVARSREIDLTAADEATLDALWQEVKARGAS